MKWRYVWDFVILLVVLWWVTFTPPGKEIRGRVEKWLIGKQIVVKEKAVPADLLTESDFQWKLRAMDGGIVDFSQLKGKVVLVQFLTTSCALCLHKIPMMQELYDTYKSKVTFLLVSQDAKQNEIFDFMRANDYTIPIYYPINPPAKKLSYVDKVSWIFIAKDGRISVEKLGTQTPTKDQVVKKLETLLEAP